MYALVLDEFDAPRGIARQKLNEQLFAPFDPEERAEYDKERWGLDPDAIAAASAQDAMFGDVSFD